MPRSRRSGHFSFVAWRGLRNLGRFGIAGAFAMAPTLAAAATWVVDADGQASVTSCTDAAAAPTQIGPTIGIRIITVPIRMFCFHWGSSNTKRSAAITLIGRGCEGPGVMAGWGGGAIGAIGGA